ncbi:MAG: DMT family transporter [Lachnospiraceae bacterium]|nr:DMT family transporter [Lachnospiraceae bacterium]
MKKDKIKIISSLLLLLTAFIWGIAFVAQTVGMEHVGPWTFVCTRYILSTFVLLPVTFIMVRRGNNACAADKTTGAKMAAGDDDIPNTSDNLRQTLLGGLCCGFFLGAASIAQQVGMLQTSPGKAGFITALYVVLVPILGFFIGKRPGLRIWLCVVIGLTGLYLISVKENFTIDKGDALVMLCALLFSLQILSADHFSRRVSSTVALANAEFFVATLIAMIGMFLFETPNFADIRSAAIPILYAGVFSGGVAYTLQIVAQKNTDPAIASLLMSLESVFALLAGFVILHQMLTIRELIGCGLVLAAVILAELPVHRKKSQ